jgi:rhodanese-related sulfurtransferase
MNSKALPVRKILSEARMITLLSVCCAALASSGWCAGQTVTVRTFENLQALVNEYPEGTTFSLAPGIHRCQSVVPKNNDVFIGENGAILSGAELLGNFSQSGSNWVSQVQVSKASSYRGQCQSSAPACMFPEDLFFDSIPRTRVTSLAEVRPGKWYLDYSTGKVHMGDNPSGHTVEVSVLAHAFTGSASSVTISKLIIEKYACVAGDGAVEGGAGSTYWEVEGSEIRHNHGMGIRSGTGMWIHGNKIHHNGQLGLGGGGNDILVQSNNIYLNNYSGYDYSWEAGGVKFAEVHNLTVQYNYSYSNGGPGFWDDINSRYVVYDSNQATNNKVAGILHEIGYNATITNNYIWNDASNPSGADLWWGAGILISNSSDVTVEGNVVTNCMNGIGGILQNRGNGPDGQPYLLQNLSVTGNTVTQTTGIAAGIVMGAGFDNSVYTSWNNHFENNTFNLALPATYDYFFWLNEPWTLASWDKYSSIH